MSNSKVFKIMKRLIALVFVLTACTYSQAQIIKCKTADGRTYYLDHGCPSSAEATNTNISNRHPDPPTLEQQASQQTARQDALDAANPPVECRFTGPVKRSVPFLERNLDEPTKWVQDTSDSAGMALVKATTQECLRNLKAVREGRPTSSLALDRYKAVYERPIIQSNPVYIRR